MKIYKFLITIFCMVFFSTIDAMLLPFLPYIYMSSTVVVEDRARTILSREWVNWLYAQNSSITTNNDIRSNIDYYHEMILNHYKHLLYNKQNTNQIKKIKLKNAVISSVINSGIWAAFAYFLNKAKSTASYNGRDDYAILCGVSGYLGFFSLIVNLFFLDSYRIHDRELNYELKRDEHMLQQFEEFKAIHSK